MSDYYFENAKGGDSPEQRDLLIKTLVERAFNDGIKLAMMNLDVVPWDGRRDVPHRFSDTCQRLADMLGEETTRVQIATQIRRATEQGVQRLQQEFSDEELADMEIKVKVIKVIVLTKENIEYITSQLQQEAADEAVRRSQEDSSEAAQDFADSIGGKRQNTPESPVDPGIFKGLNITNS